MKAHASLIRVDSRRDPDGVEYLVMVPEDGNEMGREAGAVRLADSNAWEALTPDRTSAGVFGSVLDAIHALIDRT
ncbi:MAG: hypothetical protein Q4F65_11250 [Propionibacteriaceae bacterium]|nr:hypothetical protein [Propionibacteriaceae bacterium]